MSTARADCRFSQCSGVRVIFDDRRQLEPPQEPAAQGKAILAFDVKRADNPPVPDIYGTAKPDSDSLDWMASQQWTNEPIELVEDPPGAVVPHHCHSHKLLDAPLTVAYADLQFRPADLHTEVHLSRRPSEHRSAASIQIPCRPIQT